MHNSYRNNFVIHALQTGRIKILANGRIIPFWKASYQLFEEGRRLSCYWHALTFLQIKTFPKSSVSVGAEGEGRMEE